jgi:CRP/FNR family cyclic AMP-dependent transcriptional regulator
MMHYPMGGEVAGVPFLQDAGLGGRIVSLRPGSVFFAQGDPADSVFFIQSGRAKITALSSAGKEAIITLPSAGDFIGEESLAGTNRRRNTAAVAVTACSVAKIERQEMIRILRSDHAFSEVFLKFLLSRTMFIQANLVDHMFNCSEKRLARILLSMAEFGKPGEPEPIPKITQKQLAEMVGTTRSRVSFFMNRFKKLGFIEYKGGIQVNKSLLDVAPYD